MDAHANDNANAGGSTIALCERCSSKLKIVCLQLPTQVFKEWVGRSGIFFIYLFFFFVVGLYKVTSPMLKRNKDKK